MVAGYGADLSGHPVLSMRPCDVRFDARSRRPRCSSGIAMGPPFSVLSFDQILGHNGPVTGIPDMTILAGIDADRLTAFAAREKRRFAVSRPRSKAALMRGAAAYLDGVPLHWMKDWPLPHLPVIDKAKGARITDIDGY